MAHVFTSGHVAVELHILTLCLVLADCEPSNLVGCESVNTNEHATASVFGEAFVLRGMAINLAWGKSKGEPRAVSSSVTARPRRSDSTELGCGVRAYSGLLPGDAAVNAAALYRVRTCLFWCLLRSGYGRSNLQTLVYSVYPST